MKFISTILIVTFSFWSYSQCTVTIETPTDSVDCGGCFTLTAVGVAQQTLMNEDFNNSTLGTGWFANQTSCSPILVALHQMVLHQLGSEVNKPNHAF